MYLFQLLQGIHTCTVNCEYIVLYRIAGKFGGLAVCVKTAKLKSAKFFMRTCTYWRYRTIPPNLIPIMVLKTSFWAKPPNLMTANISGYTVNMKVLDHIPSS